MGHRHDRSGGPGCRGRLGSAGRGSACLCRNRLGARFRDQIGDSPMSHLAKVRLGQAAGYLVTADLSVESIARRTGYASSASLSKAFKREFGVSPGHYRRCRGDIGELRIH
ncbi:MAG TPA: helix-turn-helix transcriptional regulator [Streptosporangiaceae bacterium]|nr:helix-turn-helix transcriptional regulator [Streptosporangiaceae bacterium]